MTEVQESFSQHVFSFEPFTQHAFYTTINQALIQQALAHLQAIPPATPLTVVDLACGTGAITELVAQALAQRGQSARFIALDSAAEALECARGRLSGLPVTFLQSNVSDLDELDHQIDHADLVFFCNAIHLVSGKEALFTRLARMLRPGGVLACNSTFFDGAYVPGTEGCYRLSIRRALEFLRRDYPGVRPARQAGTPAMEWLTAADYKRLFESTGFSTLRCPLQQGDLPLQAWQDIGSYSGFIAGALPGIPLHLGALALRDAAERVFSEMGLTVIPRYWLQMTAVAE